MKVNENYRQARRILTQKILYDEIIQQGFKFLASFMCFLGC